MKLMTDQGSLIRQGENESIGTTVDPTTNASSFYGISSSPTSAAAAAAAAASIGFYTHSAPNLTLTGNGNSLFASTPGHSIGHQQSQTLPTVASFYTNRTDVGPFIHSSGK